MKTLDDVYALAAEKGITIDCFHLWEAESLSHMDNDGDCYIAIDPMLLKGEQDEENKLLHEVAHCVTGAFYSVRDSALMRSKYEARAERFAFKWKVPYIDLMKAVSCGHTEAWEIAEYLNAPENIVRKAMEYYQAGNR